ncbi:hypothetical protein [Methanimicrococcus hongohii]|nr:hypothetical protein [Methanimicrococcus sp. Hf6]
MKDLSMKIRNTLEEIEDNEIDIDLLLILKETKPFTDSKAKSKLEELDENTEIDADAYYQDFQHIVKDLLNKIEKNEQEIKGLNEIFLKYVENEEIESENAQALVSLVFKDAETNTRLEKFADSLYHWNRALLTYNSLLKSECPEDISLVEIQNGSAEVIFEIGKDIAADLAESTKTGLNVFGAYLTRKLITRDVVDSYLGNKKLIELEKQIDELMLDNIKESIAKNIEAQYAESIRNGTGRTVFVDEKINEISIVLTEHIIRGNELKLLTPLRSENCENMLSEELRRKSVLVQKRLRQLDAEDKKSLREYSIKEEYVKSTVEYEVKTENKKEMIELGNITFYENEPIEADIEEVTDENPPENNNFGGYENITEEITASDEDASEYDDDEIVSIGDGNEVYGTGEEIYSTDENNYGIEESNYGIEEDVYGGITSKSEPFEGAEVMESENDVTFEDGAIIDFGKKNITKSGNFVSYGNEAKSSSGYRIGAKGDDKEKSGAKKRIMDFIY